MRMQIANFLRTVLLGMLALGACLAGIVPKCRHHSGERKNPDSGRTIFDP